MIVINPQENVDTNNTLLHVYRNDCCCRIQMGSSKLA